MYANQEDEKKSLKVTTWENYILYFCWPQSFITMLKKRVERDTWAVSLFPHPLPTHTYMCFCELHAT